MGKIKAHGISLEGSDPFDAGTTIKGHILVELEQPLKVRGIRITFKGSAKVTWTETEAEHDSDGGVRQKTVTYQSSETYLKNPLVLHGISPSEGNTTIEMPPGRHTFPFTFTLPDTLPGSFEGPFGYVRYYAKSNIDLPWKIDPKVKMPFIVRPIVDLDLDPVNSVGLFDEKEKTLCCLCCKSGPISATFKIKQQGFVPEQAIEIFSEINNDTNRTMFMSYVDLKRTTVYFAQGHVKIKTATIAKVTRPAIGPHQKDIWEGEPLIVPPTPPSGFPGCGIIDVSYQLKLHVVPGWFSKDLKIPLCINIGTIPIPVRQQLPAPQEKFAAQTPTVPSNNATDELTASTSNEGNASTVCAADDQGPPGYVPAAAHAKGDKEDGQGDAEPNAKG